MTGTTLPATHLQLHAGSGKGHSIPGLQVERIADHAWRVAECDSSDGITTLLGFVEKRADLYEVMQLGATFNWTSFPTLDGALEHMKSIASETMTGRTGSDLQWIR
ncbi:hypothetical protein [Subtercola sp. YIM 133946]|uniref:hypothetical protein n=1 Tax=Subtercola sp. YIM 133946 TaxID=3118909 RepID=UPI002F956E4E